MIYKFEQVRRSLEPSDFPISETADQDSTVELVEDFLIIPKFDPLETI